MIRLIMVLTHWGRVTHICVSKLTIIGSDNGLSPDRRQVIIWTNAGILLIGPLGTNFSGTLIEILTFSYKKMRLKVSSARWRPFCLGLNVLNAESPIFNGPSEAAMATHTNHDSSFSIPNFVNFIAKSAQTYCACKKTSVHSIFSNLECYT